MSPLISDPVKALQACVNVLKARGDDTQKPSLFPAKTRLRADPALQLPVIVASTLLVEKQAPGLNHTLDEELKKVFSEKRTMKHRHRRR